MLNLMFFEMNLSVMLGVNFMLLVSMIPASRQMLDIMIFVMVVSVMLNAGYNVVVDDTRITIDAGYNVFCNGCQRHAGCRI